VTKRVVYGLASGAVGTAALNMTTYLDMAVRGRASSELPTKAAEELSQRVGVRWSDDEAAQNRKSALGALLGYATGCGIGMAYGLLRPRAQGVPTVAAGTAVGLAAMAASDLPMTLLGLTDPREWDAKSWVSDLAPHLVYGLCTAAVYEAFSS
jgi:hypothetical protein